MREGQRDLLTGRVREVRAPPPLERDVHIAVADVLRDYIDPDWFWFHPASGEYRTDATAALLQRMGVRPGVPDLALIAPSGLFHGLELKRRGGHLSRIQREFEAWCRPRSIPFEMRDSFEGALDVLKGWGALKIKMRVTA